MTVSSSKTPQFRHNDLRRLHRLIPIMRRRSGIAAVPKAGIREPPARLWLLPVGGPYRLELNKKAPTCFQIEARSPSIFFLRRRRWLFTIYDVQERHHLRHAPIFTDKGLRRLHITHGRHPEKRFQRRQSIQALIIDRAAHRPGPVKLLLEALQQGVERRLEFVRLNHPIRQIHANRPIDSDDDQIFSPLLRQAKPHQARPNDGQAILHRRLGKGLLYDVLVRVVLLGAFLRHKSK